MLELRLVYGFCFFFFFFHSCSQNTTLLTENSVRVVIKYNVILNLHIFAYALYSMFKRTGHILLNCLVNFFRFYTSVLNAVRSGR